MDQIITTSPYNRITPTADLISYFRSFSDIPFVKDVHVSWLRQAVEEDPRHPRFIKTVRGAGYRLDVEGYPKPIPFNSGNSD